MLQSHGASFAFALAITLAGCGGGGGGESTPAPGAEGAYTTYSDYYLQFVVLDDDQFWFFPGAIEVPGGYTASLLQGQGVSNSGSFTVADARDFLSSSGPPRTASLTASYVPGATFSGELSSVLGVSTLNATAVPARYFDYLRPASLSSVVGSWIIYITTGPSRNAASQVLGELVIAPTGKLSGKHIILSDTLAFTGLECGFTGTFAPRPTGRNVFDVSMTFGSAPCALPGQSMTGIALIFSGSPDSSQLLLAAVDRDRNNGTGLFGFRPSPGLVIF